MTVMLVAMYSFGIDKDLLEHFQRDSGDSWTEFPYSKLIRIVETIIPQSESKSKSAAAQSSLRLCTIKIVVIFSTFTS